MGGGVLLVMLMLLQLSTGSLKSALLVMANLPLAVIGGIVAIFVTESQNLFANIPHFLDWGALYSSRHFDRKHGRVHHIVWNCGTQRHSARQSLCPYCSKRI
jgi:hypothetical protein